MFKKIYNSNIPKVIKALLYILLIVTLVYLIIITLYKILNLLRIFLHWATDEHNWWTFVTCVIILLIGSLLIAQFVLGLDPFGNFFRNIVDKFDSFRTWLGNLIIGK